MSGYTLLVSEVPHNKAELISDAAVKAGSFGGTVCMARRISASNIVAALGLGGTTLDLVYILVENSSKDKIQKAIIEAACNEKSGFGIMYSIDAGSLIKNKMSYGGELKMNEYSHELISVILNKGYADDAMAAARKAGAGGGTVINARGTAREDDEKFFGMHIVPEKEMLLIVVDSSKKDAVLKAVQELKCLNEPGSGIAFSTGVNEFTLLGKKTD